jgi:hypothetical protein
MNDFNKAIEEARAEILPYESWERIAGESSAAFAAFCTYRDFGLERNVRKAVGRFDNDEAIIAKRYRVWRNWSTQFRWRERAADFDRYMEKLKQTEMRKTIEAQGEKHRAVTGKMLDVVQKKLDTMNPDELTQSNVTEWVQTAIKAEREAGQFADANSLGVSTSRNSSLKQGELNFVSDFQGL